MSSRGLIFQLILLKLYIIAQHNAFFNVDISAVEHGNGMTDLFFLSE